MIPYMHSVFPIIGSTRTDGERCENCTYMFYTNITFSNLATV